MKKILLSLSICITSLSIAQTAFWTENFGTNPVCQSTAATVYSSTNGAWAVTNTGTNGSFANLWYVSAKEANTGLGNCSDGCSNNPTLINMTMHMSSAFGDLGAAYAAGSGFETDKRVETPVINCTNASAITMTLSYLMWGINSVDYCEFYYYDGTSWNSLGIPAQTPTTSCAGQGIWTGYTVTLPASANNNANVKLGFRWKNTDPSGADPSVAIDDIALIGTVTTPTAVMSPSFSISSPMCAGASATLTANTGTTSATGYTWSAVPSGATFSAPNGSVTTVSFANANTYSVTLTAASGTLVGSVTHTVLVNPLPTLVAVATKSAICAGETNTLNATGTATSFGWQPGNMSGLTVTIAPTSATIYTVSGPSAAGCVGTKTVSFIVNPLPSVNISANTTTVCLGSVETLTANGASTYTWMPDNTSGSTLVITPSVNTTYTVTGTSAAGCVGSSTISIAVVSCTTGLNVQSLQNLNLEVYPNPFNQEINVSMNSNSTIRYLISDAIGKEIMKGTLEGSSTKINTDELSKGIYFIEFSSGQGEKIGTFKIIKE